VLAKHCIVSYAVIVYKVLSLEFMYWPALHCLCFFKPSNRLLVGSVTNITVLALAASVNSLLKALQVSKQTIRMLQAIFKYTYIGAIVTGH